MSMSAATRLVNGQGTNPANAQTATPKDGGFLQTAKKVCLFIPWAMSWIPLTICVICVTPFIGIMYVGSQMQKKILRGLFPTLDYYGTSKGMKGYLKGIIVNHINRNPFSRE